MIQTVKIPNFASNNILENTRLASDTALGVSTLPVQNTDGFAHLDYALVGTPGDESSEIVIINVVTDSVSMTTSAATVLEHSRYDQVNKLFGNTINVYSALNVDGLQPPDSAFTLIGNVAIESDQAMTEYQDSVGSSAYWYKYTYFNSTTSAETNIADSKSARGGGSGDYCSIDAIRQEAGFKNAPYITDDIIDVKRQAAQQEINSSLQGFYDIPFAVPVNAFISDICVRLAAGLLLLEQYGTTQGMSTKDGNATLVGARADIQRLALKEIELTDTNGQSTAQAGATGGVSSWPNMTTSSTAPWDGGAPRSFRMSDRLGYFGRKF